MFYDDRFAGNWPDLVARLDAAGTVRRWAAADPALTGLTGIEHITAVTAKGADPDRADAVLGALVRWPPLTVVTTPTRSCCCCICCPTGRLPWLPGCRGRVTWWRWSLPS